MLKTQKIMKNRTEQPWELPTAPKRLPDPPKTFPKPAPDPPKTLPKPLPSASKINFLCEIVTNPKKIKKNSKKLPTWLPKPSQNPSQIHLKSLKKRRLKTH